MLELITIFLFSVSLRSANLSESNIPFDYEFAFGLKGDYNRASLLYERENGRLYNAFDVRLKYGYVDFSAYQKTAKKINSQRLSVLYPVGKLSGGATYSFKAWGDPQLLATISYKGKHVTAFYSKGRDREEAAAEFGKTFKTTEKISLKPLLVFKNYNGKTFWQSKIQIEFKLN